MALNAQATQNFVPIREVRDGIIILKDDGLRAIVMASSVNLSLKSAEEQQATIAEFQNFLNSLDFSTQIVIQSRKLDIRPYLAMLENRMKEQLEPLIKIQIKEYIEFIASFTEQVNVMTKSFFVVVSYSTPAIGGNGDKGILGMFSKKKNETQKEADMSAFEEKRSQLEQRISVVQDGLNRMGVRSVQLGTEEIVELFYKTFNPGDISRGIKLDGAITNNEK